MIFWAILKSGVFFVPLLCQESVAMCILAWALLLAGVSVQLVLSRSGKAHWKRWILPIVSILTVVVCEISAVFLVLGKTPWLGAVAMLIEVFTLYVFTGVLLGLILCAVKKRMHRKSNSETSETME